MLYILCNKYICHVIFILHIHIYTYIHIRYIYILYIYIYIIMLLAIQQSPAEYDLQTESYIITVS